MLEEHDKVYNKKYNFKNLEYLYWKVFLISFTNRFKVNLNIDISNKIWDYIKCYFFRNIILNDLLEETNYQKYYFDNLEDTYPLPLMRYYRGSLNPYRSLDEFKMSVKNILDNSNRKEHYDIKILQN